MSEILSVERLETPSWGRASGFDLALPDRRFVVLYGPNESGKTSLASALSWLIAGPGSASLLQRFGRPGDKIAARLRGRLGADAVTIESRVTVPQAASKRIVSGRFSASIADVALGRSELTARLGGGDFDSYQRLYWVEALDIADGSDLQESVSVQAMFGGVNPFDQSSALSSAARELLGASRGRAAEGSSRDLLGQIDSIDAELRGLAGGRDEWARIEADLEDEKGERRAIEQRLGELGSDLRSARRATRAFSEGVVERRNRLRADLANTTVPTDDERDLHGRTTQVQADIGRLAAAQSGVSQAQAGYDTALGAVHGDWRSMVPSAPLGNTAVEAARLAAAQLVEAMREQRNSEAALQGAIAGYQQWRVEAEQLRSEWEQKYPHGGAPDRVIKAASRQSGSGSSRAAVIGDSGRSRWSRLAGAVGSLVGTACTVAVAVMLGLQGDWRAAAVGAVGAVVLVLTMLLAWRSLRPPDDDMVRLAERRVGTEKQRDAAQEQRGVLEADSKTKRSLTNGRRQELTAKLVALGVLPDLISRFESDAVAHLEAVRSAQAAGESLDQCRRAEAAQLSTLRSHFAESASASPPAVSMPTGIAGPSPVGDKASGHQSAQRELFEDTAGAEALLRAVCVRVDDYDSAVSEAQQAQDDLGRAVEFDDTALEHTSDSDLAALTMLIAGLERDIGVLEAEFEQRGQHIASLTADARALESPQHSSALMSLRRNELMSQVESRVVRGLGHHVAARLLTDVAERHRKTRQPALLERTKQIVVEVADWTNVTVNPHAPTDRTDNLLVDSPRGEHSAHRLSFGAQSLLYLALRIATVEDQSAARGVRLPLIFDDVLVGLDDARAQRCVGVLTECAVHHQLILLTCHRGTAGRAEAAGAAVVEVPPEA